MISQRCGWVSVVLALLSFGCSGSDDSEATEHAAGGEGGAAGDAAGGGAGDGGAGGVAGGEPGGAAGMTAAGAGGVAGMGGVAGAGGVSGTAGAGGAGGTGSTLPSITGPAQPSADGNVLTSHPSILFARTGGDFTVTSAYLDMTVLPDFTSVRIFGEFVNETSDLLCIPLATVTIDGSDIITVGYGPAYQLSSSSVSSVCIAPGESGVFGGIRNNVPVTLIDGPATFSYEITGLVVAGAVPHPGDPTVTTANVIAAPADRYAINGQMRGGVVDIYNLRMSFFIRDPSGLIRGELRAFPANLQTIPAGAPEPFETDGIEGIFDEWEVFNDFIREGGVASWYSGKPEAADPVSARLDAAELARAAYRQAVAELD